MTPWKNLEEITLSGTSQTCSREAVGRQWQCSGGAGGDQGDEAWPFLLHAWKVEPKGFPERLGYAVGEGELKDEPQMFGLNDWKHEIASH